MEDSTQQQPGPVIPAEAVEAAAKAALGRNLNKRTLELILEAAAPIMLADVERELSDAKRVIALLVTEAGGKVALSRRAIAELSDATVLETTQDVVNGGFVIRARATAVRDATK